MSFYKVVSLPGSNGNAKRYDDRDLNMKGKALVVDDVLYKPFSLKDLDKLISIYTYEEVPVN